MCFRLRQFSYYLLWTLQISFRSITTCFRLQWQLKLWWLSWTNLENFQLKLSRFLFNQNSVSMRKVVLPKNCTDDISLCFPDHFIAQKHINKNHKLYTQRALRKLTSKNETWIANIKIISKQKARRSTALRFT